MSIHKPAHKDTEHPAGQIVNSDSRRGVLSDKAKKLSDVIDRVIKSEKVSEKSHVCSCPNCGYVMHITTETNLPEGWKK